MRHTTKWLAILIYVLVVMGVAAGMFRARTWARETYGTEEAQVGWDQWRQEVRRKLAKSDQADREVPKSPQPPALVLMNDYFGVCLGFALLLTSVLYIAVVWMAIGAFSRK